MFILPAGDQREVGENVAGCCKEAWGTHPTLRLPEKIYVRIRCVNGNMFTGIFRSSIFFRLSPSRKKTKSKKSKN